MSRTSKIVLSALVIVIIGGGMWVYSMRSSNSNDGHGAAMNTSSTSASNTKDTSNANITNDTENIDAQMNGLNSDSSNTAPQSDNQ